MSEDKFTWRVTTETTGNVKGVVNRTQYGDGYAQSSADGINHMKGTFPVVLVGYTAEVTPARDFIEAHFGESFRWKPPLRNEGYFYCDEYDYNEIGGGFYRFSATFTQTYQA